MSKKFYKIDENGDVFIPLEMRENVGITDIADLTVVSESIMVSNIYTDCVQKINSDGKLHIPPNILNFLCITADSKLTVFVEDDYIVIEKA